MNKLQRRFYFCVWPLFPVTKIVALYLRSKPFEPPPTLTVVPSASSNVTDWLADRESADFRLSSLARVISGGAEQPRSQACQGPSEEDQGELQRSTSSPTNLHLPPGTKWINLSSTLHLLKKCHGEGGGQGPESERARGIWNNSGWCFSWPTLIHMKTKSSMKPDSLTFKKNPGVSRPFLWVEMLQPTTAKQLQCNQLSVLKSVN